MSEQIKIAFASFGRGMASFVRPWRFVDCNQPEQPRQRGIGRHFAAVGWRLSRAVDKYAESHPEIAVNAI